MRTEKMETLEYYMNLPYTKTLRRDEDGDVVARIDELPGCVAHGENDEEALANLTDVQTGWIEARLAEKLKIPEPERQPSSSGKWVQRTARTQHRELTLLAQREGVSLNHLVSVVLARAAEILRVNSLDAFRLQSSHHASEIWLDEGEGAWDIQLSLHPASLNKTLAAVNRLLRNAQIERGSTE